MSIARGGFAQVYTGRWNGKQVAIKVPLDKVALDVIVQEALELHHVQRCQEVVRFHGMALQHGLGSGLPGLVMDYMAGGSVGEILERYKQQRLGPLLVPFVSCQAGNCGRHCTSCIMLCTGPIMLSLVIADRVNHDPLCPPMHSHIATR